MQLYPTVKKPSPCEQGKGYSLLYHLFQHTVIWVPDNGRTPAKPTNFSYATPERSSSAAYSCRISPLPALCTFWKQITLSILVVLTYGNSWFYYKLSYFYCQVHM